MLCDPLKTLLQIISLQRSADLSDEMFFLGFQMHPKVTNFRDVMVVNRLLVFLCKKNKNKNKCVKLSFSYYY